MSMLNRNVTFRFSCSDIQITVEMLDNIRGLRYKGDRPSVVEFSFKENEQLTNIELEWIEQCVKPALKDSFEIKYKENK